MQLENLKKLLKTNSDAELNHEEKGSRTFLYKRHTFIFFEILNISSAPYGSKNRYIMQKFISWFKITCNNIVLNNLTLLCMVVQRSKVYLAKCTVTIRLPVIEIPEIGELK